MRSLPDQLRSVPSIRPVSIAGAASPYLGLSAEGLAGRRVEDAALLVLAAVLTERGPVRERLQAEQLAFERVVYAVNRCPTHGGGQ